MKTLKQLSLKGKKVLIRSDLNVPLSNEQIVLNNNRIIASIPTINYVLEQGGIPILISHLGRPKGQVLPKFSLKPVLIELGRLLNKEVKFSRTCIGEEVERLVSSAKQSDVILLENLRYNPGEEAGEEEFAKKLAALADVFVNDAFGTAHRAHASMYALAKLFKEKAPGLLMQKELDYFNKALLDPKRPLCVVLGGAKVSSKLPLIKNLSTKADHIIIGGAMANTFLAAQGNEVGMSLYEPELFDEVRQFADLQLHLPEDFILGTAPDQPASGETVEASAIPSDRMVLDIGPKSVEKFSKILSESKTIVWNGPMGAFENPDFASGTLEIAKTIAATDALSVVGGGDSVSAIQQMGLESGFDYISTGGGAFLELLEGKELPGVVALED